MCWIFKCLKCVLHALWIAQKQTSISSASRLLINFYGTLNIVCFLTSVIWKIYITRPPDRMLINKRFKTKSDLPKPVDVTNTMQHEVLLTKTPQWICKFIIKVTRRKHQVCIGLCANVRNHRQSAGLTSSPVQMHRLLTLTPEDNQRPVTTAQVKFVIPAPHLMCFYSW